MSDKLVKKDGASDIIAKLVLEGDLSKLSGPEKVEYYSRYCESLGLNPLTRPFQLIKFEGKLIMYPTKDCTEQLRKINEVSIIEVSTQELRGLFVVTAKAQDKTGKVDVSTAAIALTKDEKVWVERPTPQDPKAGYYKKTGKKIPVEGDDLANLLMKTETKAKRRVTLSICGLGSIEDNPGGESFLNEKINPDEIVYRHSEEPIDEPGAKGDFLPKAKIDKVVELFEPLGILRGDLEEKIGHKLHLLTQIEFDALAKIFHKIKASPEEALGKFRDEKFITTIEIKETPAEVKVEPVITQEPVKEEKKPLI